MAIFASTGSPLTVGPANGGKIYAYNALTASPVVVAPANAARQTITFHNPGTVDVFIGPASAFASASASSPTTLTPTTSSYGGCFRVYANGGTLILTGECQGQWQGFAASGETNALTVMDSNT